MMSWQRTAFLKAAGEAMMTSVRVARLWGWMPGAAAFGLLIGSSAALAAPFCLQTLTVPPQCMYYDANLCRNDAAKQGGWCSPNPGSTLAGTGSGQYCVVTSQGASTCAFLDRVTCDSEAARQHGVCYHDEARATGAPDPYAASGGPYAPAPTP
jgi:hypothetical protein